MTSEPLYRLSALDLSSGYRAKAFSPLDVTQSVLKRVSEVDETVNAFFHLDADAALDSAAAATERWRKGEPLSMIDGVPATIKSNILVKGWPAVKGSPTIDPKGPWEEDAPATARLKEAGAVLLGLTNMPEFGWKGVTDSPLSGITRNPWNTSRTPGGSSGGAAAAAALGMGALHIGTDGGGSIRIPASFSGVFGLKAHFGRVPAYPASPFGSLSHIGPITRTVTDAAMMLTVLAGTDTRDWTRLPPSEADYAGKLEGSVDGLLIAYVPEFAGAVPDPAVRAVTDRAVEALAALGAEVETPDLALPHDPLETFTTLWHAGAHHVFEKLTAKQRAVVDPGFEAIAEHGATISLRQYLEAQNQRAALATRLNRIFETYDLLAMPTMPVPPLNVMRDVPEGSDMRFWQEWSRYTFPFNLTQQPAASLPAGFTPDGLPVGLQLVGPQFYEELVLNACRAYEEANPFPMPSVPVVTHSV
ncbi:MAG: amidase [Alphaproteobacteria bacterium]|nr:amidase [Alphaproteobacteria bacterium]